MAQEVSRPDAPRTATSLAAEMCHRDGGHHADHHGGLACLIGATPVVQLGRLPAPGSAEVWLKLEGTNPGGSVKDRIALSMLSAAIGSGLLRRGMTVIEPTSGNTGIGLAMLCAALGYGCRLVMPDSMSIERRSMLAAYGARLELTPAADGMAGAVARATEIVASRPDRFYMPNQFANPANPAAHRQTARELLASPGPPIDAMVAGVGTGGTITGCGLALREVCPGVELIAVEPDESPVLSGGSPGPHSIQGIGAGFVPGVLDLSLITAVVRVSSAAAVEMCRRLAREEGLLLGISSGAATVAALEAAARLGPGRRVVAVAPDRGDRYLSTGTWGGATG